MPVSVYHHQLRCCWHLQLRLASFSPHSQLIKIFHSTSRTSWRASSAETQYWIQVEYSATTSLSHWNPWKRGYAIFARDTSSAQNLRCKLQTQPPSNSSSLPSITHIHSLLRTRVTISNPTFSVDVNTIFRQRWQLHYPHYSQAPTPWLCSRAR